MPMSKQTRHTMIAEVPVKFWFPGLVAHPTIAIIFDYLPGRPAYTPCGEYAPIDPPEPPEISFVEATLIDGDGLAPTMSQLQEWASDWLNEDGFNEACDYAEQHSGPDPDEAYERMRDEPDHD